MASSSKEAEVAWPPIAREKRIYYEILFYSQGPLEGYLTGEYARDLFLHSRLPLMILSQVWNLADVSNDNLLSVDEFVLAMHLIHGLLNGLKLPRVLPPHLKPKETPKVILPPITDRENEAYTKVFQSCQTGHLACLDGLQVKELLQASELPGQDLADVWDYSDINRDGLLDKQEWTVACQLVRLLKKGEKFDGGGVNSVSYIPDRIAPNSLHARKLRVEEYDKHKQRLMSFKEKRKKQADQEKKRLDLLKKKISLEKDLVHKLKRLGIKCLSDQDIQSLHSDNKEEQEKLEEIVARLKKEHEIIRQETVKVILGEKKLHGELDALKSERALLTKKLTSVHSKATKDPDPFHQLYEQRKEERKKSNLSEGEEPEIHYPFKISPFDKEALNFLVSGSQLFLNCHNNKNINTSSEYSDIISSLCKFSDDFVDQWSGASTPTNTSENKQLGSSVMEDEEDTIFMTVQEDEGEVSKHWRSLGWTDSLTTHDDAELAHLHRKLLDLKNEMKKLNNNGRGRLVFRNPSDYLARKKAKEEEEQEKAKVVRRTKSVADSYDVTKRRSYTDGRREETLSELKAKRKSLNLERTQGQREKPAVNPRKHAPERPNKLPVRTSPLKKDKAESSEQGVLAKEELKRVQEPEIKTEARSRIECSPSKLPKAVASKSPTRTAAISPTRSSKKIRAPEPPPSTRASSPPARQERSSSPPSQQPSVVLDTHKSESSVVLLKKRVHSPPEENRVSEKETQKLVKVKEEGKEDFHEKHRDTSPCRPPRKKRHTSPNGPKDSSTQSHVHNVNINLRQPEERVVISHSVTFQSDSKSAEQVQEDLILPASKQLEETTPENFRRKSPVIATQNGTDHLNHSLKFQEPEPLLEVTANPVVVQPEVKVNSYRNLSNKVVNLNTTTEEEEEDEEISRLTQNPKRDLVLPDTVSLASVQSESDSLPPELPCSPPPCLPANQRPLDSPQEEFEVIAIVASPVPEICPPSPHLSEKQIKVREKTSEAPSVSVEQDQIKPETVERSFRLPTMSVDHSLVTESVPAPLSSEVNGDVSVYFNDLALEAKMSKEEKEAKDAKENYEELKLDNMKYDIKVDEMKAKEKEDDSADSDISDMDENPNQFEAHFTPGNSSETVPISVNIDDKEDVGVHLISINASTGSLQSPQSTTDSAFDEMMSSMHSNDPDNGTTNSLSNTLEDAQDTLVTEIIDTIEVVEVNNNYDNSSATQIIYVDEQESEETEDEPLPKTQEEDREPPLPAAPIPVVKTTQEVEELISVSEETVVHSEPVKTDSVDSEVSTFKESTETEQRETTPPPTPVERVPKANSPLPENKEEPASIIKTSPKAKSAPKGRVTFDLSSTSSTATPYMSFTQKAKAFSESINEPPKFTIKASTKDVSEERLRQLDSERKAIIKMSTRAVILSDSDEDDDHKADKENDEPGKKGPQFDVKRSASTDDEPLTAGQINFGNRVNRKGPLAPEFPEKVNLTESEVQNPENSTEVDTESIADLNSTRQRWESLFNTGPTKTSTPKPPASNKKSVKHWEVKLPYKPAPGAIQKPASNMDNEEVESAIDREIRLANEREEMLRREQAERQALLERQAASKQKQKQEEEIVVNNNNNTEKPMFMELTEADRGSEMQQREDKIKRELVEQQEREKEALQSRTATKETEPNNNGESIIEREIRQQKEREEEIRQQQHQEKSTEADNIEDNKEISYEEAIATYQHAGESLIAKELRETREREEELQRLREKLSENKISSPSPAPSTKAPEPVQKPTALSLESPRNEPKPKITNEVQPKASSQSPRVTLSMKVSPRVELSTNGLDLPQQEKKETPIEREIRLARERENELRRQKGLPEIPYVKETEVNGSVENEETAEASTYVPLRSPFDNKTDLFKKRLSSSRLQKELQQQRERELSLRKEGKIITTSEDHIQSFKYTEVTGADKTDAPVKRNFVTRKSINSDLEQTPSEQSDTDSVKDMPVFTPQISKEEPKFRPSALGGGPTFSYRESSQKAESMIEKELREMREREEELRQQRARSGVQTK